MFLPGKKRPRKSARPASQHVLEEENEDSSASTSAATEDTELWIDQPHGKSTSSSDQTWTMTMDPETPLRLKISRRDDERVPATEPDEKSSATESGDQTSTAEMLGELGTKVQDMLGKIGDGINKTLLAKKQRMETYMKESSTSSEKKLENIWKQNQSDMQRINDEYFQKCEALFEAWELELNKFKERQEKLANDFHQQRKAFQQSRMMQVQRMEAIKAAEEKFLKDLEELEEANDGLFTKTQSEFEEELAVLQRKVVTESKQKDVTSVKKTH